jgi:hypothetical protein
MDKESTRGMLFHQELPANGQGIHALEEYYSIKNYQLMDKESY